MKIGQGTFANAGAVGIFYQYPIQFEFFAKKPSKTTSLTVKYWDVEKNTVIWEEKINAPEIAEGYQTTAQHSISDRDGYTYSGWKIVTPDSKILESGSENRNVNVVLDYTTPDKVLNVEFIPVKVTPTSGKVRILVKNNFNGKTLNDGISYVYGFPNDIIITKSYISKIASSYNCDYDMNDYDVTDFSDNPMNIHRVSYSSIYPDLKRDNVRIYNGNVQVTLTEDEPEMIVTFYVTPRSEGKVTGDISSDCSNASINWMEKHSHTVTWKDSFGHSHSETCIHTYAYEVHLKDIECSISPDTLKSGYGFDLTLSYGMSSVSKAERGKGTSSHCVVGCSSSPQETAKIADKAVFAFPDETYTVNVGRKQNYTQPYIFNLEATSKSSSSIKFEPPVSEISTSGERKIFTPVTIAGTAESPVVHHAIIQISGGGVSGTEFCYNVPVTFIINGDMYEDGKEM